MDLSGEVAEWQRKKAEGKAANKEERFGSAYFPVLTVARAI